MYLLRTNIKSQKFLMFICSMFVEIDRIDYNMELIENDEYVKK